MKTNLTTSLVLDIFELLIRTEETLLPEHRPGGFKDVIDRLKKELNEQTSVYLPSSSGVKDFNPLGLKVHNPNFPGLVNPFIGPTANTNDTWNWENKEVRYGCSSGLTLTSEQIEAFKKTIPPIKIG